MSGFSMQDYEFFSRWLDGKISGAGKPAYPAMRDAEVEFIMQTEEPESFNHSVLTRLRNYADYAANHSKTGFKPLGRFYRSMTTIASEAAHLLTQLIFGKNMLTLWLSHVHYPGNLVLRRLLWIPASPRNLPRPNVSVTN